MPIFDDYEFYWRLDTDSTCSADINDAFETLVRVNASYGYNVEAGDGGDYVEGLWNTAVKYIDKNHLEPTFMYKSDIFKAWGERNGKFSPSSTPTISRTDDSRVS